MSITRRTLFAISICLILLAIGAMSSASETPPSTPTFYFEGPCEAEPNDTYQTANGPLRSHRAYYGYPNDLKDYFSLQLYEAGTITVDLTGHTGQDVQLQMFQGVPSEATRVASDVVAPYHLEYAGPSGTYYIYIYTGGGYNSDTAYTLRAIFPMVHTVNLPLVLNDNLPSNRAPDMPTAPSPVDGATDQSVDVNLSWTGGDPDGDAVTYDVYLEADDDTPNSRVCADLAVASCDPGELVDGTQYYWQVVARDAYGATTLGPVWGFSTVGMGGPPEPPANVQATDGAYPCQVRVTWDASADATSYEVYEKDSADDIALAGTTSDTKFDAATGRLGKSYAVKACNTHGCSDYSNWDDGHATFEPNTPASPSPPDGAGNQSTEVQLTWTGGHPCGLDVEYDVYFAADDATPDTLACENITTTSCDPGELKPSTHYCWQVEATSLVTGTVKTTTGPVWDFTTRGEQSTPYIMDSTAFEPYAGSNSTYVVGQVHNPTAVGVTSVRVFTDFYDAQGGLVDSSDTLVCLTNLAPGMKSPFLDPVSDLPISSWSTSESRLEWQTAGYIPIPFEVTGEITFWDSSDAFHVVGTARNTHSQPLEYVRACVALLDAEGKTIGRGLEFLDPFDAGASTGFDVDVYFWKHKPDRSQVADYTLQVYAVYGETTANQHLRLIEEQEEKMKELQRQLDTARQQELTGAR